MKHIALIYSSKYGQTRKIATFMRDRLLSEGFKVSLDCIDDGHTQKLSPLVDAVIVGAPVYREKFSKPLLSWINSRSADLAKRPSAFYSVSLNAADERVECRVGDQRVLTRFLDRVNWEPTFVASFAGAIKFTQYNWFIRFILKRISASAGGPTDTTKDHELTDWRIIEKFLKDFTHGEINSPFLTSRVLPKLRDHRNKIEKVWEDFVSPGIPIQ